jgi:hypothetical protein
LPLAVFLDVWIVRVADPDPTTEVGLKVAVERGGNPLALKVTVPLKFPLAVTVTVSLVLALGETGFGAKEVAKSVKPPFKLTTRVAVVE